MSKKIIALLLALISVLSCSVFAFAADDGQTAENEYVEYFDDGSYLVATVTYEETLARASTVSGSKKGVLYNSDGEALITFVLQGSFSYTGSSATCTSSSVSYNVHNSSWKVTSATASKSGSTAIGDFTAKRYLLLVPVETKTVAIKLSCSSTGVLS